MDWDLVQVFLAAYTHGSLSAAARELGINQSTASRRLSALEESLGSKLFDRTPDGLLPTSLGMSVHPLAESMASSAHEFARMAAGTDQRVSGQVRLATAEGLASHVLMPAMHILQRKYPDVHLHMLVGLGTVDLTRREADLALRYVKPTSPDMIAKRVVTLHHGIYASRDYLASHPALTADSVDWIGIAEHLSHYPDAMWMNQYTPEPIMRLDSYMLLHRAVQCGLGVSILDTALANLDDTLVELDWGLPPIPSIDLWLVTHRVMRRVARIDAVWKWVLEAIEPLVAVNRERTAGTSPPPKPQDDP